MFDIIKKPKINQSTQEKIGAAFNKDAQLGKMERKQYHDWAEPII